MADQEDWIAWDNSMKTHIDQLEVKWRHDLYNVLKDSAEIQKLQAKLNDELVKAAEEAEANHKRTVTWIALCWILLTINLGVGVLAYTEIMLP
jgi:hypothetical protein